MQAQKESFNIVQIGCGVVGHAYIDAYMEAGHNITGIEASKKLVQKYQKEMKMYHISDDLSGIKNIDFIMISVCTPLKNERLDMTYIYSTIPNVVELVKNNPDVFVVVRSTVQPTTTRKYKQILEEKLEKKVNVIFQPEFLRAVSAEVDARNPWYVVIGRDEGLDVTKMVDLYCGFTSRKNISILSVEEAELLKIYHNCFNAAKISFFNQCGLLCDSINKKEGTNIDINKITTTLVKTCEGLINPKYGTKAGHGYYGTCLPKDSGELASLEKVYELESNLFKSVVDVNKAVVKTDKEEVLHGDYHIGYDKFVK